MMLFGLAEPSSPSVSHFTLLYLTHYCLIWNQHLRQLKFQISAKLHWTAPRKWISGSGIFLSNVSSCLSSYCLFLPQKYAQLPLKAHFRLIFSHRISNGLNGPPYADFSSTLFCLFSNPLVCTQEPDSSKYSKPLHTAAIFSAVHAVFLQIALSCPLLFFKHAEFLVRPIDLIPGNSCFSRRKFRASRLRCGPGYRHNDITILIIVWKSPIMSDFC